MIVALVQEAEALVVGLRVDRKRMAQRVEQQGLGVPMSDCFQVQVDNLLNGFFGGSSFNDGTTAPPHKTPLSSVLISHVSSIWCA